jgi:hypothetical protein
MRKTKISQGLIAVALLLVVAAFAAAHRKPLQSQGNSPPHAREVDLVVALDTSGSMDGLIDSARGKLWDIVNLMAKAEPTPVLRVGLISYGNTGHDPAKGWVKKEIDLTTDLDTVYAKLFALRTNGGDEYVARAVQTATREMEWHANALKIVFVAGNEPATQDPVVPLETALRDASEHGILVNAIYCGNESAGEVAGWRQVAALGHGEFASIDQNHVVAIATPMDAELGRLSAALNSTYVGYGADGERGLANQALQDKNASAGGGSVVASRAVTKGGRMYDARRWDLVDAQANGKDIKKMAPEELPAPMQAMAPAAREAFVKEKAAERLKVQAKIGELAKQREVYLKNERKKPAAPGAQADLDDALSKTLKQEAQKAGFKF